MLIIGWTSCLLVCISYVINIVILCYLTITQLFNFFAWFQVYSGARPLLEKTMKILVEGLVDIFLSVFHENKTKDIRLLDANGFCQLMLEASVWLLLFVTRFFSSHSYVYGSASLHSLQRLVLFACSLSTLRQYYTHTSHLRHSRLWNPFKKICWKRPAKVWQKPWRILGTNVDQHVAVKMLPLMDKHQSHLMICS